MKKESLFLLNSEDYEIKSVFNGIAEIRTKDGMVGLLSFKRNQLVGSLDYYDTYLSYLSSEFYFQFKECNKYHEIRIYDTLNEKMIVDNWKIIEAYGKSKKMYILESPIDGKLHIFDVFSHTTLNLFDMAFDNIVSIDSTHLLLTIDGKKGVYNYDVDKKTEIVIPIEYDDIEYSYPILILTKNNERTFSFLKDDSIVNRAFDEIKVLENSFVSCKKDNTVYVYHRDLKRRVLEAYADEVTIGMSQYNDCNYYITNKDGKFGLMRDNAYGKETDYPKGIVLIPEIYDSIKRTNKNGLFFLMKDGKKGALIVYNSEVIKKIEPKYDEIEYRGKNGNDFFALYSSSNSKDDNNAKCDIGFIDKDVSLTTLVSCCELIDQHKSQYLILYKKDGKYGMIPYIRKKYNETTLSGYDNITFLDSKKLIVEKNNKKGFVDVNELVIPVEYDEITLLNIDFDDYALLEKDGKQGVFHLSPDHVLNEYSYFSEKNGKYGDKFIIPLEYDSIINGSNSYYFGLKKGCNWNLFHLDFDEEPVLKKCNSIDYDSIEFYEQIILCKDRTSTYIYDYKLTLLETLPLCSSVVELLEKKRGYNKDDYLYCIDGICYCYYGLFKTFKKVYPNDELVYLTRYETGSDIFEVRSTNKEEHDSFCSRIDSMDEKTAEKYLRSISSDSSTEKPQTLRLKRISKRENI